MTLYRRKPKNNARRTLTCRKCRVLVAKAEHAQRMADWHTPGHPEFDCDGTVQEFDSKLEAETWHTLCQALDGGYLTEVRRQVKYPIHCGGTYVGSYIADFVIVQRQSRGGEVAPVTRIIDNKGIRHDRSGRKVSIDTPLARFKRKCVEAEYGVTVELWPDAKGAL